MLFVQYFTLHEYMHVVVLQLQLNPDNSNLQGKSKKVRVIGGLELLRVKFISKKIT